MSVDPGVVVAVVAVVTATVGGFGHVVILLTRIEARLTRLETLAEKEG